MSWLDDQRERAKLESHKERVRQVFAHKFTNIKTSEWMQGLIYLEGARNIDELKAVCKSHGIVWKDEGDMTTKNEELAKLKAEISKLNAQVEKLEYGRWGKEPANGSVFKIERRFEARGTGYTYAAVRASGLWYITGTRGDAIKSYTWEGLQVWAGKYSRVWKMTVVEELVD